MSSPLPAPEIGTSTPLPPPLPGQAATFAPPTISQRLAPPITPARPAPGQGAPTQLAPTRAASPVLAEVQTARRKHTGLWIGVAAVAALGAGGLYLLNTADPDRPTLSTVVDTTAVLLVTTPNRTTIPASTIPASTIPASTVPASTVPASTVVETTATETTVAATAVPETTVAPVGSTIPLDPATLVVPTDGITFAAATGWTMQIGPAWTVYDIPNFTEEVAWTTGANAASSSIVNVISEAPAADIDLASYLALNVTGLSEIAPKA